MKPIEHYLKSNLYARKYPATAHDFRIAVPPEMPGEAFDVAGDLFSAGYRANDIRQTLRRLAKL
mgnify:CR=1 FL=1